jgi:hypothetical protein
MESVRRNAITALKNGSEKERLAIRRVREEGAKQHRLKSGS